MTSLKTQVLLREFYYNGVRVPGPDPAMTVEQVRDLLSNFPEIATASISGPEDTGTELRYTFSRAIERAKAISDVGQTIINSAKVELQAMELIGAQEPAPFFDHARLP